MDVLAVKKMSIKKIAALLTLSILLLRIFTLYPQSHNGRKDQSNGGVAEKVQPG